jgi:chemotaxis protein methyltransferase CheR
MVDLAVLDPKTFERFRQVVYREAGITLSTGKEALVASRIGKRMRALGIDTAGGYLDLVESDHSGEELIHLIDAISTNVTSFFREADHFDFLAKTVAGWKQAGQRKFRMWCAAASTGEEPYSIAITLAECGILDGFDTKVLCTDISTQVLGHCQHGVYTADRVATVDPQLRSKWFSRTPEGDMQVHPTLKKHLVFRRLNLAKPPFPMNGPLDLVFCRNVMIYFDNLTRVALVREVHRLLRPGGFLLVGHAESLNGVQTAMSLQSPSIYVKR